MKPYSYSIVYMDNERISLRDDNFPGTRSLTNAAEEVTKEIYDNFGDLRIFYYDTEGQYDEMEHNHGVFLGFREA